MAIGTALSALVGGGMQGYDFVDNVQARQERRDRAEQKWEWAKEDRERADERRETEKSVFEGAYDHARDTFDGGAAPTGGAGPAPRRGREKGVMVEPARASGGGASAPADGRPRHAFERFREAGLSEAVSAGLVGNLMQESGPSIDTAAIGDNGNAYGAAQWNGPRREAYMAFAKERGADPADFDAQIDFLLHEGQTSEKAAWEAINRAQTPEEAARIASERFWRPGVPHVDKRQGYATSVYSQLASPTPAPPERPAAPAATAGVGRSILDAGEEIVSMFY